MCQLTFSNKEIAILVKEDVNSLGESSTIDWWVYWRSFQKINVDIYSVCDDVRLTEH